MHGRSVRDRGRAGGAELAGRPHGPRLWPVDFLVGLLAERAETLGEPYSRHLGGKVRELPFHLLRQQTCVTYWLAPDGRVVLLAVFRKPRSAEAAEVQRAVEAQRTCGATHDVAHDNYEREGKSR